jgi:long-chain fatty acid transport protein
MFKRSCRSAVLLAATGSSLALAASARAGGFSIYEQGARGMGFAGAYTAQAADPSAIFHNAAGIAFLKGQHLYLGGTVISPSTDFTGADPFPGAGNVESQDVGMIPVPAAYYTHAFTERLVFGVGVHAPFGLRSEWANPDTFSGRFISHSANLEGIALNPTVAYKLADRLAIGGGVDIRFTSVELTRRVPSFNPFTQRVVDVAEVAIHGDRSTGIGFNVGLLARPTESFSLGLSYRHKVKTDYSGTATFTQVPTGNAQLDTLVTNSVPSGAQAIETSVEVPAIFSGGIAYSWTDWTFEADVVWFQWSTFDALPVTFLDRPELSEVIAQNYSNTFQYRVGLERRLNERWTVRGGYFYDESPAPVASVSPILPDADRHGLALGASWTSGRVRLDAGSWYLFVKDRSTNGESRDQFEGTYSSRVLTFGLSLGYSF